MKTRIVRLVTNFISMVLLSVVWPLFGVGGMALADSSYTISGNISFTDNGQPATLNSGVSIQYSNPPDNTCPEPSGVSDTSGNYSIPGYSDCDYNATLAYSGTLDNSGVFDAFNFSDLQTINPSVSVSGADATENYDIPIVDLAVTVTDAQGNPVANAPVSATIDCSAVIATTDSSVSFSAFQANYDSCWSNSTKANSQGVAHLAVFPGAQYSIYTQSATGPYLYTNVPVTVNSDMATTVQLPPLSTISGNVSFTDNGQVGQMTSGFIKVTNTQVREANVNFVSNVLTDSNGNYAVTGLGEGDYSPTLTAFGTLTVNGTPATFDFGTTFNQNQYLNASGANYTENFPFAVNLVTVTVEDMSGNPISGASATVEGTGTFNTTDNNYSFDGGISSETATTNSSGQATFAVIPGLTYGMCARYGSTNNCNTGIGTTTEVVNADTAATVYVGALLPRPTPVTVNVPAVTNQFPTISWPAVPGAVKYDIYRGWDPLTDGIDELIGNTTGTSFTDNTLTDSTGENGQIIYCVSAVNAVGLSVTFLEYGDSCTPTFVFDRNPPTLGTPIFSPNPDGLGQNTQLSVPASSDAAGVAGGEYYIGNTDPGVGNGTLMTYDGTNLNATLGSNLPAGRYTINIRAEDNAGNWSPVTTTTLNVVPIPTTPAGFAANQVITNQPPSLSWGTTQYATSYNVYRNGTLIANVPAPTTSYVDSSLASDGSADGIYAYSVSAVDVAGESMQTSSINVTYDTTAPVVTISGVVNGETYLSDNAPDPICNTADALSGVAANASLTVTNSGTSYTATCSGATDLAGNITPSVSMSYNLLPSNYSLVNFSDSSGNNLNGAKVTIEDSHSNVTTLSTDSFGNAFSNTAPGTYKITVYFANGFESQNVTVTANGPNMVSFTTVPVTISINDLNSSDIGNATVAQAGNTGNFGPKTPVNSGGQVTFQVLPGTNHFTAYVANGYQEQSINATVAGPNNVTFNTDSVVVTVVKNGNPLTTATVAHAGNSGNYGSKQPVDPTTAQYTFYVLPGTNYFTAYDGTIFTKQTLNVTGNTSTSISVN